MKISMRKITIFAVTFSIVLILGSSVYVYALAGDYTRVAETDNFEVYLRIDKVNFNPKAFTMVQTSVKIKSLSESDILVLEFSVKAYSAPPNNEGSKKFGEQSEYNVLIPAMGTKITKVNVKVQNYSDFKAADHAHVYCTIKWMHFGQYHERTYAREIYYGQYKYLLPP